MNPIIVDANLRERMLTANGLTEIRDDSGMVLGQFFPNPRLTERIDESDWPSDEELDRRLRESPRYTADQVMERLRSLTRSE